MSATHNKKAAPSGGSLFISYQLRAWRARKVGYRIEHHLGYLASRCVVVRQEDGSITAYHLVAHRRLDVLVERISRWYIGERRYGRVEQRPACRQHHDLGELCA